MFRFLAIYTVLFINSALSKECSILDGLAITLSGDEGLQTTTSRDKLESAYRIAIENQNLPTVCKNGFANLNRLDTLIIEASGVRRIEPGAFINLASLRNLIITDNNIKEIENGVFGDLLMRKLNLSNNGISKIHPQAFENLMNLEVLDLHSNKLKTFENEWFKYTPKLYRLDFTYNSIASLPEDAFMNIIKNKQKKDNLELWFMHNSINSIDRRAFHNVKKIRDLWLSHNSLTNIDVEVFANVEQIETLYLDNNLFPCFEDSFLKILKVKELDIDGNPIDCDCLEKIKKIKRERNIEVQHLRIGLRCVLNKLRHIQNKEDIA